MIDKEIDDQQTAILKKSAVELYRQHFLKF